MHLDVQELRNFYYRSRLGRAVQTVLRNDLRRCWPKVAGQSVVGFGFAAPLLRPYLTEARRVTALMPGPQGCMPWPPEGPNVSVLCEDTLWPVASGAADRLVLLHGLETSDHPAALLDEAWRVLAPEGRIVFIVPNRTGLWSRSDRTPFGYGRPYTMSQLDAQLRRHDFRIESARSTLYQPPSEKRVGRRMAAILEGVGRHIPVFRAGGVLVVEAAKHVAAPQRPGLPEAVVRPLRILEGIGKPVAEPSRRCAPARGRARPAGTRSAASNP